jgi:hypothetical protein
MKIIDKLRIGKKYILTLDGDVLSENANKVLIDGVTYDFDVADNLKNTIGVDLNEVLSDHVEFLK